VTGAPRLVVLQVRRAVWITGLALAAACALLALVLWHPGPLWGVPPGLLLASFPLLAHLDAIRLDGPRLSVRRGFRWVGPVDLDHLVALGYRPPTHRRPPVWLLIQRQAGARRRWYWRWNVEPDLRARLDRLDGLRVVEVAAGGRLSEAPGLADHLADHVLTSDALVEARARAALARLRS
jgi:hypothetical protein